jgi:hypothetical protein
MNMEISELYQWEVETPEKVIRQYNDDGTENPSTMIPVDEVVRASIISRNGGPRHDLLIDREKGERFIKRFGRGFIKNTKDGFHLAEYVHCIITTHYRLWVFSTTGQGLVTNPEFEVYL